MTRPRIDWLASAPLGGLDLHPGDVVTFPWISTADGAARDALRHEPLAVSSSGIAAITLCDGARSWEAVTATLARQHGVPVGQVSADLAQFVAAADARHLVRVRRRLRSRLTPAALTVRGLALASLEVSRLEQRRYPPTLLGTLRAATWACRLPVALAAVASALLMATLLMQPSIDLFSAIVGGLSPAVVVAVVVASICAHEAGHLLALGAAGRRGADVCTRPMQAYVRHAPIVSADLRRTVAVAGPVFGLAFGLAVAAALWWVNLGPAGTPWVGVLVGVAHLSSLAPWALDGKALYARKAPHVS